MLLERTACKAVYPEVELSCTLIHCRVRVSRTNRCGAAVASCGSKFLVRLQDIEKVLEPILFFFKNRRRPGEALGDFTARVGFDALRQYSKVRISS